MGDTFRVLFMSWQICDIMEARQSFIEDVLRNSLSMAEVCRRHGISRKTGYKWLDRYRLYGVDGLKDESKRPRSSPAQTSAEVEAKVLAIRELHPCWGGRKIRKVMQNEGLSIELLPAASTITNILRRNGKLGGGTREGVATYTRFERGAPNELWQMDFKGHFAMDGSQRCYPLTVLDDHSRYNLVLEACLNESRKGVQEILTRAFKRYGLPKEILCDHGSPWGSGFDSQGRKYGTPGFEVWLTRLGIRLIHGRVRHPQTQGKEERFHRTFKAEVLMRESLWRDLTHCQNEFNSWREIYNHKRPHESLDMETPGNRYQLSARCYPEILPPEESFYLEDDELRKVQSKGEINFQSGSFYIGAGYTGELIALRPTGELKWDVYHCWKRLGHIDLRKQIKRKSYYTRLLP